MHCRYQLQATAAATLSPQITAALPPHSGGYCTIMISCCRTWPSRGEYTAYRLSFTILPCREAGRQPHTQKEGDSQQIVEALC